MNHPRATTTAFSRRAHAARRLAFACAAALCITLTAHPAHAQRGLKDIPDPDPMAEKATFQIHEGFEVNLYASDPMIAKPIQMNFDSRGRLWIASSEVYPHIKPGQEATDKILVLEDTDGDGRADKSTVFADGLLIPTGVEPGDGGAYIANSTELLHMRDTDGDGKADHTRVMLSGFGTEDTHHILHTLRWGPDGMLYFNQSIYIHSHIETPYGVRRLNGGGIWHFRPETMQLEIFVRGFVNPWGHCFDDWGQSFATDGAHNLGPNYLFPGAAYFTAVGVPRTLAGLAPGNPKQCGIAILNGRHLPEEWRGQILTNDFRGNRINRFAVQEDGAGFAVRKVADLLSARSVAFRPIDIKMGPDGAIYVADWYNPIIQHGEVDFRDERRDHTHGRIWRITAKDRPLVQAPKLIGATTESLLDALKLPEYWSRQHAKRVLKERGRQVLPALTRWVQQLDAAGPQFEHHRLEALWVYQSLDVVEPDLLKTVLRSKDHRARAAAMRVVYHWLRRLDNPLELLAAGVNDDHPRVRLEAVRVLGQLGSTHAMALAMKVLDRPMDRFLDYALWVTCRELSPQWLAAMKAGQFDFGGDARQLTFALKAVEQPAAIKPLVELFKQGRIAADRRQGVLELIAALGGPDDLATVLEQALSDGTAPTQRAALVEALINATRQRKVKPAGDLARIADLLADDSIALRAAAARAAGLWQVDSARTRLVELASAPTTDARLRHAAIDGLASLGDVASRRTLEQLAGPTHPIDVRMLATVALAGLDVQSGAFRAVEVLAAAGPDSDVTAVYKPFMTIADGPTALAKALADRKLPPDVAKLGLRAFSSSGRDAPDLVQALMNAGNLTNPNRQLTADQMQQMIEDVAKLGDPARGEAIYRRENLGCVKCHSIGGSGGLVGPDIASAGASAPVDYLVESLLQPNAKVKENFNVVTVVTDENQVITGIPVRQTDSELILRDASDEPVVIPLKSIQSKRTGKSLMPDGLSDALTRHELVDLMAFLSRLGKPGPYNVGEARLIRTWRTVVKDEASADHFRHHGLSAFALGDVPAVRWTPAYSMVDGELPLRDMSMVWVNGPTYAVVRGRLNVTTAGKVALRINSADGVRLWVDTTEVPVEPTTTLDLAAGTRTLTFALDPTKHGPTLRVELLDAPGSPARAQVVNGK